MLDHALIAGDQESASGRRADADSPIHHTQPVGNGGPGQQVGMVDVRTSVGEIVHRNRCSRRSGGSRPTHDRAMRARHLGSNPKSGSGGSSSTRGFRGGRCPAAAAVRAQRPQPPDRSVPVRGRRHVELADDGPAATVSDPVPPRQRPARSAPGCGRPADARRGLRPAAGRDSWGTAAGPILPRASSADLREGPLRVGLNRQGRRGGSATRRLPARRWARRWERRWERTVGRRRGSRASRSDSDGGGGGERKLKPSQPCRRGTGESRDHQAQQVSSTAHHLDRLSRQGQWARGRESFSVTGPPRASP